MCVAPVLLVVRDRLESVACRSCWQCRANRLNDLVGRAIAESEVSDATLAVTLTYSGDVPASAVLTYRDFQSFVKRLRFAGYSVRYLVAGEYGSKRGRAHWHAILFFRGAVPDVPLEERIEWPFWSDAASGRGFVFFQRPDYGGMAYVLKYALKDRDQRVSRSHYSLSKKPPLGFDWFMRWADQHVDQRLAPQSSWYSFASHFDFKGKRRRFFVQGRMRELFLERFLSGWEAAYGSPPPLSEVVEDFEDRLVRREVERTFDLRRWADYLDARRPRNPRLYLHDEAADLREVVSYVPVPGRDILIVRFADGSSDIHGDETWQAKDGNELARVLGGLGVEPRFRPLEFRAGR